MPLHRIVLLGVVQEQDPADAIPHHMKGHPEALRARRRTALVLPVLLIPARTGADIFVFMGDIGGRGWGKGVTGWRRQTQDPAGGGGGDGGGVDGSYSKGETGDITVRVEKRRNTGRDQRGKREKEDPLTGHQHTGEGDSAHAGGAREPTDNSTKVEGRGGSDE